MLSERPKISVAIALYNGAEFIAAQLRSLLFQSRVPDEIILTDDSLDDSTFKAVEPFLTDRRIRYFRNDSTLGVTGNFGRALSCCTGEFIFLCDQDDVWLEHKVETMVQALLDSPECDGAFCNSRAVDADLAPLGFSLWQMRGFSPRLQRLAEKDTLNVFLRKVTLSGHNIVLRRRALGYILPLPELAPFYPDTWIALQTAIHSNWKIVPEELTLYRVHQSNQSAPVMGGVRTQLELSRQSRKKAAASRRAAIAGELLTRLAEDTPLFTRLRLADYAAFQQRRADYSSNWISKTFEIFIELIQGKYHAYADGVKSALADLIL